MSSAAEVADAWGIVPPPEEGAWVRPYRFSVALRP